jgi:hypothetical protein
MLNNNQRKELADFVVFTQLQLKNIEQFANREMDRNIIQELIVMKNNTSDTIIELFKED